MIKAIIFDSDGMLTSSKMFSEELEKEFEISAERLLPFFKSEFQECLIGKADLKEELKKYINEWGWKASVDELTEFWFKTEHEINKQIVQEIKELRQKGIKCYLGTNQEKYRTEYMRESMGFIGLFDGVFSSAEIGAKKPERNFFEFVYDQINNRHRIEKNEIMFWDDDGKNVQGAMEFGFQSHLYSDFDDFKKLFPSLLILRDFDKNRGWNLPLGFKNVANTNEILKSLCLI